MEWLRTAETEESEVWTAVEYINRDNGPQMAQPLTPARIDKRLMDSVWDSAKELTRTLSQVQYVQVGLSGIALRLEKVEVAE